MPFRKRFGVAGTWEFLSVVIVCGIITLTAGTVAYVRSTYAVTKVRESDEANCERTNKRFVKVRDYLDGIINQEAQDPADREEFDGLLEVLGPVDCQR